MKIIAAGGKDRIQKVLLHLNRQYKNPKVLVLTDLSNFGLQYRLLVKRCTENPNIYFYDYLSFEAMLFESRFIKGITNLNQFDYITLEKFYEKALENFTRQTSVKYQHGKFLSQCYLKECGTCNNCQFVCKNKYRNIVGDDSCLLKLTNEKF